MGAVTITRALKAKAEAALGTELVYAAAAVPPGTIGKNKDVVGHVLESAGFEVTCILDEPTAAANVLGILMALLLRRWWYYRHKYFKGWPSCIYRG